jgi:serine/threonine protein kinase/uncharacterized protein YecT (DUF1311 family)
MMPPSFTPGDLPPDLQGLEEEFELLRELGRGAITSVYLARERATGQLVAIKAIRKRFLHDDDALLRFSREARVVAELDHPNIVRTYGVLEIGERTLAIVMQYVQGPTLREAMIEERPFLIPRAERVLADIATALAYAHRQGLVHRDVKPENIFLDEENERTLLSDFGIARSMDGDSNLTRTGMVVGTPSYMSPEQIDGRQLDGRSDLYSLGMVGWEMLAGRRPWEGESIYGVIYKHKHEPLPALTAARPEVPRRLRLAIEGAIRKDRDQRWASADEFLTRLGTRQREARRAVARQAQDDMTTMRLRRDLLEKHGAFEAPPPTPRRRSGLAITAGVLALLAVGLFVADRERARRAESVSAAAESLTVETGPGVVIKDSSSPAPATPAKTPPSDAPTPPAPSMPVRPTAGVTLSRSGEDSLLLCDIAGMTSQRACLRARIAENDVELTRVYRELIAALRRQAGAAAGVETADVRSLRAEQRRWIVERDRICRDADSAVQDGLWAQPIADCLGDVSTRRAAELRARLDSLGTA